jgi:PEP-CTERM motif
MKRAALASVAVLTVAACLAAGPAHALTVGVDNVQLLYSESLNINGFVDGSSYSDNNQLAGQIVLTVNNVGSATQYQLPAWCVDIFQDIYLGSSGFQFSQGLLSTDNSTGTADAPALLTETQITTILDLATYGNALIKSSPTNHTSALVQAAIWTEEYNNTSGNTLAVTGGDITAQDITDITAAAFAYGGSGGQLISLNGVQQQVYDGPVPEPATLGLLAVSILGIGVVHHRKGLKATLRST